MDDLESRTFQEISDSINEDLGIYMSPSRIFSKMYMTENGDRVYRTDDIDIEFPFAKHMGKYWDKESFIIADYLYPNDEHMGLTAQQILTCPFIYLTHTSHLIHVKDIMNDGFLKYYKEAVDQYPGVYCYPNLHSENDAHTNIKLEVTYILSLSLLRKRSWHINRHEDYGNISSNTYDYITLPKYLKSDYLEENPHVFEEIIFHDNIPIDYIGAIVVRNDDILDQVNRLLPRKIPIFTQAQWKQLPLVKMIKGILSDGQYSDLQPNFCYGNMGGYDSKVLSYDSIRSTLLNSGFSNREIDDFFFKMKRHELISFLKQMWKTSLKNGERYPTIIHPPYTNTY